ncbi:hypothetical protein FA13DRAFT_1741802, partial [Coprinellus micaceus]
MGERKFEPEHEIKPRRGDISPLITVVKAMTQRPFALSFAWIDSLLACGLSAIFQGKL